MSSSSRLAALLVLVGARVAAADKPAAEAAFAEAKKLVAAGKIAEACPKFEVSQKQDPQLGTLLNLADCHERLGKLATAWAEFREAMELAKNRRDDRESYATERSEKLAPRLAHVTLVSFSAQNLSVWLDGRDVTALVGVRIPVDPGEHVIVTRTGDGPEGKTVVRAEQEAQSIEVKVPLQIEPPAAPARAHPGRTRRIAALATGGVGVVVAGVGLYFGKRSFDLYDESRDHCADNICDGRGAALVDDSKSAALKANILIGVGLGAIAVGTVLFFTAPKERGAALTARPVFGPDAVGGVIDLHF